MFETNKRILVLGIGNRLKGDDGFGSVLAQRLKVYENENIRIIDAKEVPENYIAQIMNFKPKFIIVIDTIYSKEKKPGEIFILEDIQSLPSLSTHASSLNLLLDLLRVQDLKFKTFLFGVVPKDISFNEFLSQEVKSGLDKIFEQFPKFLKFYVKNKAKKGKK